MTQFQSSIQSSDSIINSTSLNSTVVVVKCVVLKCVVCEIREKNLLMEHPVGGAFSNSEERLLNKIKVLEKEIEDLGAKVEFRESEVDFFRQEEGGRELAPQERIYRIKSQIRKGHSKGGSEEENAKRKPGLKGCRPGVHGVHEDREGGADDDAQK